MIPGPEKQFFFHLPADILLKNAFGDRWNEETGHGGALRAHPSAYGISGGKIWERPGGLRPGAEKKNSRWSWWTWAMAAGTPERWGIDGSLEKDVNLAIALRLKTYLEQSDVKVVMTRETDTALYGKEDSRKKDGGYEGAVPDHRGKRRGSGGQHPPEQLSPGGGFRRPGLLL